MDRRKAAVDALTNPPIPGIEQLNGAYLPLEPAMKDSILKEIKGTEPAVALTSNKLQMESIRFAVNGVIGDIRNDIYGAPGDDNIQPRLTILLQVKIQGDATEPTRIIQTTVSERNLNIKP